MARAKRLEKLQSDRRSSARSALSHGMHRFGAPLDKVKVHKDHNIVFYPKYRHWIIEGHEDWGSFMRLEDAQKKLDIYLRQEGPFNHAERNLRDAQERNS